MANSCNVYKVDTLNNHIQDLQNSTIHQNQPGIIPSGPNSSNIQQVSALVKMINSGDLDENEAVEAIRELRDKTITTLKEIEYDPTDLFEQAELLTNLTQLEKTTRVAQQILKEKYGNILNSLVIQFEETISLVHPKLNLEASLTLSFEEEYVEQSSLDAVMETITELRTSIDENLENTFMEMNPPPSEPLKQLIRGLFLPSTVVERTDVSQWITEYQRLTGGLEDHKSGITGSVGAGIQVALRMAGGLENAGITGYAPTKAVLNTLRLLFLNDNLDMLNRSDYTSHYESQEIEKAQHERLRDIYQQLGIMDPTHKESYDLIARSLTGMCPSSRAAMCQVDANLFPSWLM